MHVHRGLGRGLRRATGRHRVGGHGEQRGRAVQHGVLEQRCRPSAAGPAVSVPPAAASADDTQFAAIGRPVIAPRWASTSLPRSVPAATTALARSTLASPARARAQACGAYPSAPSGSIDVHLG